MIFDLSRLFLKKYWKFFRNRVFLPDSLFFCPVLSYWKKFLCHISHICRIYAKPRSFGIFAYFRTKNAQKTAPQFRIFPLDKRKKLEYNRKSENNFLQNLFKTSILFSEKSAVNLTWSSVKYRLVHEPNIKFFWTAKPTKKMLSFWIASNAAVMTPAKFCSKISSFGDAPNPVF